MVKRKATQPREVVAELQATSAEDTTNSNLAILGGSIKEERPLETRTTTKDTSSRHVADKVELGGEPFWALLKLAGYETW